MAPTIGQVLERAMQMPDHEIVRSLGNPGVSTDITTRFSVWGETFSSMMPPTVSSKRVQPLQDDADAKALVKDLFRRRGMRMMWRNCSLRWMPP